MISSRRLRNSGRKRRPHHLHHLFPRRFHVFPVRQSRQVIGTEVRGQDDQCISEIDRVAMSVRQTPVIEHLEQHIEHVGMSLFDLVEQDHLIGAAANHLGQGTPLLVPDVAGRRPDEARDGMPFHVLGHIDADHGLLIVEQALRQRLRELSLADTGRSQKQEGTDRPVGVLKTRPGTTYGIRHGTDGLLLTDNALGQLGFPAQGAFSRSPSSNLSTGTPVERATTFAISSAVDLLPP